MIMKYSLLHSGRILLATVLLLVCWMFSLQIAEAIIPGNLQTSQVPEEIMFSRFVIVCLIHASILYVTIRLSAWTGLRLVLVIFSMIFMVQYFLSMIEAIWFNDSLAMPFSGIMSILFSGFLLSFFFSPLIVWISGKGKPWKLQTGKSMSRQVHSNQTSYELLFSKKLFWKIPLLIVIVYPALYFLAGYFIAWQSDAVRSFYTGSVEMEDFGTMLADNIRSGLYGFQILRGLIWTVLAMPLFLMLNGSYWLKAIMTGLLFALLMNAQHLIPNPYFPPAVSYAHFIETASSNFIWGFIIILVFQAPWFSGKKEEID
jgi:hypothetical protein